MISPMPIDPVNPILMIVVKRESIVEHTLTQIMKCGPYDLKKPLKVNRNNSFEVALLFSIGHLMECQSFVTRPHAFCHARAVSMKA